MPGTDHEFTSLEAARSFGYSWSGWWGETVETRARLMAHEAERQIREAYLHEEMERRAKMGGKEPNQRDRMKAAWGLG